MNPTIFRCLGRRALSLSAQARTNATISSISRRSLSTAAPHIVDKKNIAPPKASSPPPVKEPSEVDKQPNVKTNVAPPRTRTPPKAESKLPRLPTSSWVIVRSIPPLSTLTDIIQSVNEVMDVQAQQGIVDLDAVWKGGGKVSMLVHDENADWVRSAHIVLSSHGRPTGWRLEFYNRSMAHAFLEYCRQHRFHCAWKPSTVESWESKNGNTGALDVSDSMIRVENAGENLTVDHIRHLFRRYDMTRQGPSVTIFNEKSAHKVFVVHFADATWARAAVRELQGVRVREYHLRLAQYPRQLIASD